MFRKIAHDAAVAPRRLLYFSPVRVECIGLGDEGLENSFALVRRRGLDLLHERVQLWIFGERTQLVRHLTRAAL